MKTYPLLGIIIIAFSVSLAWSQEPQIETDYPLSQDSVRHQGVPQGTVTHHVWKSSQVFPGTIRRYYVYVPAQYDVSKPAALMVFQDGHTFIGENGDYRAPVVFDNLIHAEEIPVTICVFIDPGHLTPELPPKPGWRPRPANRSFEYDTLSADYSNFLLNEILPEVEKVVTPNRYVYSSKTAVATSITNMAIGLSPTNRCTPLSHSETTT